MKKEKEKGTVRRTPPFLRPRGSTGPFSFLRATVDNWNRTHELVVRASALVDVSLFLSYLSFSIPQPFSVS